MNINKYINFTKF